jgi:hypothetical protein
MAVKLCAIDPAPRAGLIQRKDQNFIIINKMVQQLDPSFFKILKKGDFLCIDSSHILMPGSDVDFLLNRVLPMLPAGVFVHFHDIFLPFPYPERWAWRGYNEQNSLGHMIMAGGGWDVVFASHYMTRLHGEYIDKTVIGKIMAAMNTPSQSPASGLLLRKL